MSRLRAPVITLGVLLAALAVLGAGEHEPQGEDYQLNTEIADDQIRPAVAMAPDGRFLAVWNSRPSFSLRARFGGAGAAGLPLGSDILVEDLVGFLVDSDVVAQPSGEFLVVWEASEDVLFTIVNGRRLDRDGNPLGEPFLVSSVGYQANFGPVAVDADAVGRFVVVWRHCGDYYCYDNDVRLVSRRLSPMAVPSGGVEEVAGLDPSFNYSGDPDVGVFDDGSYLVVWDDPSGIHGRRGLADGGFAGPRFVIDAAAGTQQRRPAVAVEHLGSERALVVWQSAPAGSGDSDIFGRLLDPLGQPLGPAFQINTFTQGAQYRPEAAADGGGGFLVSWVSELSDGDGSGTSIRMRSGVGSALHPPPDRQVNTHTPGDQRRSAIAGAPHTALVVWRSDTSAGSDDDGTSIQARRLGPLLFSDDFESGGLSVWGTSFPATRDGSPVR